MELWKEKPRKLPRNFNLRDSIFCSQASEAPELCCTIGILFSEDLRFPKPQFFMEQRICRWSTGFHYPWSRFIPAIQSPYSLFSFPGLGLSLQFNLPIPSSLSLQYCTISSYFLFSIPILGLSLQYYLLIFSALSLQYYLPISSALSLQYYLPVSSALSLQYYLPIFSALFLHYNTISLFPLLYPYNTTCKNETE